MFFEDTVSYEEPNQGGAGTCYFISSIATAAEFPDLITDVFVGTPDETEESYPGIYGIRLYVRGKPWIVTIDDRLLFENESVTSSDGTTTTT